VPAHLNPMCRSILYFPDELSPSHASVFSPFGFIADRAIGLARMQTVTAA